MMCRRVIVICLLSVVSVTLVSSASPEVETVTGRVMGERLEYNTGAVHRYLGIPYARPPVGERRFRSPEAPPPWEGVRETTVFSPRCQQYPSQYLFPELEAGGAFSEDCLYLNVYVPERADPSGGPMAVMIWIHGGSLTNGAASQFHGEAMVVGGDVILVTINYRLNVFGFFTDGSGEAPGNAGMLDQVMAFNWVKDNIRAFGGDPDMVTIFGESAGGWSVSAHMISPMSRGLFKRAISQSGALYSYPVESTEVRSQRSVALAEVLGCNRTSSGEMLTCLRSMNASSLLEAATGLSYTATIAITIDGSFLPDDPTKLWSEGKAHAHVDYMTGFNSEEASTVLSFLPSDWYRPLLLNGVTTENPLFGALLEFAREMSYPGLAPDTMLQLMYDHYMVDTADPYTTMRQLLDYLGDMVFLGPTMNQVHNMAAGSADRVYVYYFSRVADGDLPFSFGRGDYPLVSWGAEHGTELGYMFGYMSTPDVPGSVFYNVSLADRDLGRIMTHAWTSFAKTGVPELLQDNNETVPWPSYEKATQSYAHFDDRAEKIRTRLLPQHTSFFVDILPTLGKLHTEVKAARGPSSDCPDNETEDSPSTIDCDTAEAGLFLLLAVSIVLFISLGIIIYLYCSHKRTRMYDLK